MSEIQSPAVEKDHADRHSSCQFALQGALVELAFRAVKAGWDHSEVAAALVFLVDNDMLGLTYQGELEAIFEAIDMDAGLDGHNMENRHRQAGKKTGPDKAKAVVALIQTSHPCARSAS